MMISFRGLSAALCGIFLLTAFGGCNPQRAVVVSGGTSTPTRAATKTHPASTSTPPIPSTQPTLVLATRTFTKTVRPTIQSTGISIPVPAEYIKARLQLDCFDVSPIGSKDIQLNGVMVMERQTRRDLHTYSDFFLLNLKTSDQIQLNQSGESQISHAVSPDRKQIAFENFVEDTQGNLIRKEMVIADSSGNRFAVLPWQESWASFLGWLDNQHLVFSLDARNTEENSMRKPGLLMVVDLSTGQKQILNPDFPHFVFDPSVVLPVWDTGIGIKYDPSLVLAVYPHRLSNNPEMFTYALWDLKKQQIIKTFEDIFTAYTLSGVFPTPRWSIDGSQFIFLGRTEKAEQVEYELYGVFRDGKVKQLTSLTPVTSIWNQDYNWSPDGRLISLLISSPAPGKAHLAVLNLTTLGVTDYCFPITFMKEDYGTIPPANAIWSPDSKQLVVQDWYEKLHRNVIVVDIVKRAAVKVAEDMEPIGWME